ncbi:hypothetical protein AB4Y42_13460 [Paraburkholderia sp. EG286B]|uniref:hypothetical protein n=1 Tax=Paraburkholderia sp. EG286B TaxID=3237011 RepID=UPI0034D2737A
MASLQDQTERLTASADPAGALGRLARVLTGDSRVSVTFGAGEPRIEGERFVLPARLANDGANEAPLLGALDLLAARHRYSEAARLDTPQAGVTGRVAQAIEDRRVLAQLARAFPGAQRYAQSWRMQRSEAVARRWSKLAWRECLAWAIERTLWDEAPGVLERDAAALAAALRAIDAPLGAARASQSTRASVSAAVAIVAGVRSLASRGANNMMQTAALSEGLDDESARLAQAMDAFGEDDDIEPPGAAAQPDDAGEGEGDDGAAARASAESDSAADAALSEPDAPRAATNRSPEPGRPRLSIPLTTAYDTVSDLTGRGDATAWRKLRALARAETGALKAQLERVLKADELTHWKREQERGEIDRAALARLAASRVSPLRAATARRFAWRVMRAGATRSSRCCST